MQICGKCGKVTCECKPEIVKSSLPWEGCCGEQLEQLAAAFGVERAEGEIDDILRARVQLSYIFGKPWMSGIPAGKQLDKMGQRDSRGGRHNGETDSHYRVRLMEKLIFAKQERESTTQSSTRSRSAIEDAFAAFVRGQIQ